MKEQITDFKLPEPWMSYLCKGDSKNSPDSLEVVSLILGSGSAEIYTKSKERQIAIIKKKQVLEKFSRDNTGHDRHKNGYSITSVNWRKDFAWHCWKPQKFMKKRYRAIETLYHKDEETYQ